MFSNTEFNHLKLKLDQLYLSLSGGKVNGETVFSKKVTFGSGKKTIKIHDGIIEGLDFPEGLLLGTCTTAAETAAKVVTLTDVTDFELTKGTVIVVKFTKSNTAQNPTLNVNGTGAKSIYYNTSVVTTSSLWVAAQANRYMEYMYDGTNWVWISQCFDNNTTYSAMSKSELTTGTATTSRVVRADYLKSAILELAESSDVDTADNITTFTSSDTTDANANAWTSVTKLSSGEDHKSIFAKMSQMFKNVRYLYKTLANKQDKLSTTVPSYTVNNTVVQSVKNIRRYGNIILVSLVLKFEGLATNTWYDCITGLPTGNIDTVASFSNEYGNAGTCTVAYWRSTVRAKCSHANNYYYVEIIGIVG